MFCAQHKSVHIPPLETAHIQKLFELTTVYVVGTKMSSYPLSALLRGFVWSVWKTSVRPRDRFQATGELTKYKQWKDWVLKQ